MKQEKNIKTKADSQNRQGIGDAVAGHNKLINRVYPNYIKLQCNSMLPVLLAGRDSQGLGRDGPPGRARSPGTLANRFPDHPPDIGSLPLPVEALPELASPRACRKVEGGIIKISNNKQMNINILNKKQIFNFYKHFNFFIMKKQILILAFLLVAIFASVTNSYGQATALTPSPGTAYKYEVTPSVVTTNGLFYWYVTEKPNLLDPAVTTDDGTYFTHTGSAVGNTTGGTNTLNITWTPASVGKTFFLVVKYTAESTTGNTPTTTCTVENIKSYEIKPINTLLLTVTRATSTGTDNTPNPEICPPNISAALVTPSVGVTPASVAYTFGQTILYYNIKAEGMAGKWSPRVRIPVLGGNSQAYTDVSWGVNSATPGFATMTGFAATGATQDLTLAADVDATVTGSNYLVRVTINNAGFETITNPQNIQLSVDGFVTGTLPLLSDIVSITPADYTQAAAFAKFATYSVKPRPTIDAVPAPDGATFIVKNP